VPTTSTSVWILSVIGSLLSFAAQPVTRGARPASW
jgi:hypothetical protein